LCRRRILDIFSRSGDICDQSLKWSKIDRNFASFWPPNFFGGAPPEFLEWDYKIQPDSDHVAKFQGDRLRDLGDPALKKKHHDHFIRPPVTIYKTSRCFTNSYMHRDVSVSKQMKLSFLRIHVF